MAFTTDTPIGDLLDNPTTLAVLDKHMPGLSSAPQIGMARAMGLGLKAIQSFSGGKISDEVLERTAQALAELG